MSRALLRERFQRCVRGLARSSARDDQRGSLKCKLRRSQTTMTCRVGRRGSPRAFIPDRARSVSTRSGVRPSRFEIRLPGSNSFDTADSQHVDPGPTSGRSEPSRLRGLKCMAARAFQAVQAQRVAKSIAAVLGIRTSPATGAAQT